MDAPSDIMKRLFEAGHTRQFADGEHIIIPGASPSDVFLIESGAVIQYDISRNGDMVVLNTFKPGAFFPMSYTLTGMDNPYFFAASGPEVRLKELPSSVVVSALHEHPAVAYDLLVRVYRGSNGMLGRLAEALGGTASTILANELRLQRDRFGRDEGDGFYRVALTTSQLASHTGLARETISRELPHLIASGNVKHSKGVFKISKSL